MCIITMQNSVLYTDILYQLFIQFKDEILDFINQLIQ